jgi:hypothetical protein
VVVVAQVLTPAPFFTCPRPSTTTGGSETVLPRRLSLSAVVYALQILGFVLEVSRITAAKRLHITGPWTFAVLRFVSDH